MTVQEELTRVRRIVPIAWLVTLACAGVFVLGHFLRQLNIVVNPLVWSSAQIIIALLSFTIAANVLVRYHGTGDRVSLILGLTLAVTGMIHLLAILEFYRNFLMREEQFRVPLSWMVGQTLLGLVFLFAYTIDKLLPWAREMKRKLLAVSDKRLRRQLPERRGGFFLFRRVMARVYRWYRRIEKPGRGASGPPSTKAGRGIAPHALKSYGRTQESRRGESSR